MSTAGGVSSLAKRIAQHKGLANIGNIASPTLVIWGENDLALEKCTNDTLSRYAPNARIEYLPEASHWVQMDEPEVVNQLLVGFLGARAER